MGKALKAVGTAIVIVGAVVATGGAALIPALAGGGLAGALGTAVTLGGLSVSAGTLLTVGSLVSSVGGALSQPKVSTAGSALGWVGDPNGPMHFAVGRIAVAGDLRHKKAYGPNDRMYFSAVTVVSDAGPITEFESFTANDIPVTFDVNGKANTSYFANVMWMRRQLGNQPEPSYLASPSGLERGATLPDWGPSHKLSGKAGFIVTLSENSKGSAYKGQQPKPRHIIKGLRVYDWRQDSTFPGGSGSQRLNDPTTWTFSENPALWAAKWKYGLWEGPTGRGAPQIDYQVGGIGVTPGVIDFASLTELANIADTHGWKVAAWPSTDDDKAQVLNAFLQAAGAYYIEKSGKMSCLHRAAPRVSVATVTAADTAGPIELDTSSSYVDRKNTGVPTYLSEADGWKMTALGEVSAPEWVIQDGGRQRSMPMTYSFVPVAKQAAELMCLGIANTREGISGRIPLKPYMQGIEAGSAFTITEPEFVLNGLKCLALETSYDVTTGVHTVTFVSETDGKYAYAYGQSPTPPAPPALEAVNPTFVSPPAAGDWTITPRPPSQGGTQQPGFDLTGFVSNSTATAIIVETGPSATGPWKQAYQGPPTVTNIPIDGLQPGATYFIAIQYQRNQNYSAREVFGPFTAPDLVAGDVSPTAPTIVAMQDAIDLAEKGIGSINTAVASLNATVYTAGTGLKARSDAMFADINTASTGLKAQTASLLASLNTPTTGVLARLTATEGQVATNNSAAVNRLNAIEATVNTSGTGLSARLATAESAIVTNRDAAAQRLNALEATVNTAGTGLSAKVSGLQSAVTSLTEGKANASDLSLIQTEVTTARGSAASLNARFNTVESNVAGKASSQSVTAVESSVSVRNRTFRQNAAPTSPAGGYPLVSGDRWINTTSGQNNAESAWSGSAWVSITDPRIPASAQGVTDITAKIGAVSGTVADALAGKADATRVSALEATVNTAGTGLSARVAGLQTAVSDLNSGKANASDLTALTTRVTAAEGVNTAQNTRLNTVESDVAGKASATSVSALEATVNTAGTGLLSRTGALESATASLATGKADAARVMFLEAVARNNVGYDLGPDATASQFSTQTNQAPEDQPAYTANANASVVGNGGSGYYLRRVASAVTDYTVARPVIAYKPDRIFEVRAEVAFENFNGAPGGRVRLGLRTLDGAFASVGLPTATQTVITSTVTRYKFSRLFGTPTPNGGTALDSEGAKPSWLRPIVVGPFDDQNGNRAGMVLRIFSLSIEDVTDREAAAARIGTVETATSNLQTQKADASRVTSLEATINTAGTGLSARLTTVETVAATANGAAKAIKGVVLDVNGYVSGYSSVNDGATSAFEILASVFAIRDPGSGERTEYRAGNWFIYSPTDNTRTRHGKAFGGTQKLVWWTGPSSVAEGSESKTNAYVYFSQNTAGGPRFGGSDIVNGNGTLTATASLYIVQGNRSGAGAVTTATTTISVAGGNSGATIQWIRIDGDNLVPTASTSFTTAFSTTLTTGQFKRAMFMAVISKAGQQTTVYVQADVADTGT